ncbi:MAG: glycosyltransferase [Phaeodactylibacter sp.]|uniref:glycosyltransferase n=1 Tax=Phaeodactylibacter sp. TaxID=1940289 RepID=UPI0032EF6C5D
MKKQPPIVCISNTTWHGAYTKSTVQLMSLLAQEREVLFVEYPFTIKDVVTTWLGRQQAPVRRMLGMEPRMQQIKTAYGTIVHHLVVPPVLPVDFIPLNAVFEVFFQWNARQYRRTVRRAMRQLGFENAIVVTAYNPFYGLPLIGKLDEQLNVYYCYDGIGTRRHGQRIFARDRWFSEAVDAIITSSDFIRQEKLPRNPETYTVKNGVDYELFRPYAKQALRQHGDRPKVGYLGSMDHRFDIDTVEHAIKNLSEYEFEFVGSLRNETVRDRLDVYPNTTFRPPVRPDEVPALMADCEVGIIPYLANDINRSIYPLKINEYLAVGVPVVMTAFAHLPEFEGYAWQTDGAEAFARALREAVATDSPERIQARTAFAQCNSWPAKAKEFDQLLNQLYQQKT